MAKPTWTDDEKQILREHYPNLDTKRLEAALPGRNAGAIHDMAGRLGVRKSPERLKEMAMKLVEARHKPKPS